MPQYLLSVHSAADPPPRREPSPEQLQQSMAAIQRLEDELERAGAWVFSGKLTDPGSATVVHSDHGDTLVTDGPFAESKEHVAGFYVIEASDLDDALHWAVRVSDCIGMPIEVRPFAATGHVQLLDAATA